ncbi:hypothetical protein PILCRDRAFT_604093 [Piloderma croceum F 1598]|uniref:Uncharacterized protein n=1 Tax=Piloderma croceum (strain F 1598) TaxID=765440 RepID=A0A0C3FE00_PILCF|nr:hypothetical protein PILCRDRAFT_604093 [Piloderma croceum F 1598]
MDTILSIATLSQMLAPLSASNFAKISTLMNDLLLVSGLFFVCFYWRLRVGYKFRQGFVSQYSTPKSILNRSMLLHPCPRHPCILFILHSTLAFCQYLCH